MNSTKMLVLFALFLLSKSSNFEINFKDSDYDLFLNSSGVFIRKLDGEKADIVYSSTNIEDFTVNLSIGLIFDESKETNLLNIAVDPIKVNLNLEIENLNDKVKYPGICVHDRDNYDTDFFNYYTITIHSNAIFYYDMKDLAIGTIEAYSTDNQLITRVSLSEYKFFYDSYSYICYKKIDCLQNFEIGPYDSYFVATDDDMLNLFINDIYLNEYDKSFYILFGDKKIDFPQIKEKITEKNVHLMGILENPTELNIDNEVNIDNLILTNVKFVKKNENDVLDLQFNTISIYDETKDVFPTNDCTITCNMFYEYRTNDGPSQFASITALEKECFYISPDFESNGDVFLHVKNNVVEVKNSKEKTIATVPIKSSYSKIEIHIEDQKNSNNNKVVIKNDFANLDQNLEDSFDIFFENCGQIPIDFIDWKDEKLSNFIFNINNDLVHVYQVKVTNFNSKFLSYSYNIDDENSFNFPSDAKKIVLCLFAETCSKENLAGNDVYQHPINGQDITEINNLLASYIQSNSNIEKMFLVLNEKNENQALNLPAELTNLKFLSLIYDGDEPLPITLSSFPTNSIDLEVIKCKITVEGEAKIGKLFVSENDLITVENVNQILERIVDISEKDEEIDLSESNEMKLIVKSSNSPHNLIFKSNKKFKCTIYIQANDRNYIDIPISFQTEGDSSKLEIRTINNERIVFTSIPANIETTIKFDDTEIVQHFIPSNSKDKVSICYNNNLCNQHENDEMYFSSLTENDFTSLMKLLKQDENQIYQYIRLIFHNNMDYENVNFAQIPANQTKQVQLSSYGDTGEAYLILNRDIETENIVNWQFEPNVFFWRSNDDKFFYFDDVSFKSADESYILEMLDNIYENYYFESFHLPSEFSSIYNYVINSNLLDNFGKFYIEITPENNECNIQCKDDSVILDNNENNAIQNPDFSNIYLQILDENSQNINVKINRADNSIDQVNLILTKKTGSVTIDFECTENNANDDFELNLYKLNDITVNVNKNKCNEIVFYIIDEVQNLPEINETDESNTQISSSSEFEFTQQGCSSKDKGKPNMIDSSINRILFTERLITISEKDVNESPNLLYFVPVIDNSIILIKKNVINSSIGVVSNNSPRVKLEKNENPLSFFNDLDEGKIEIKYKPENDDVPSLIFKELNNQQGSFYLNVPEIIENVSFSDIKMSQTSSFEVKHTKSTSNEAKLLIDEDEDEPTLKVSDSVFISPESNSALRNLELGGILNIYHDSTLNLTGNTSFLNTSMINLTITNVSQIYDNLLIRCDEPLQTIPDSIIVNLLTDDFDDDDRDNLKNLRIIGPLSSKDLCNDLGDAIVFENNKNLSFNHNCIESESGEILLTFSVKDKEKKKSNKLSTGAIIGIVIACIVVVAIIIGIIVYCVKRKRNIDLSTNENGKNDDDYSVDF